MRRLIGFLCLWLPANAYFWGSGEVEMLTQKPGPPTAQPSNLGCFMCTQLLSVTKHRVGLSQNQLRNQLYDKCRVLPAVFKDQCFSFVETSLPEIYFSLNYDFTSKDICVRLNLCDENNPFAVGGPLPPPITEEPSTGGRRSTDPVETTEAELVQLTGDGSATEAFDRADRIGHKNIIEIVMPRTTTAYRTRPTVPPIDSSSAEKLSGGRDNSEESRLTCAFCEKLLENAKNYASDITSFANTACSALPKGRHSDECYQMADKKIADLAKFVDQQVVDALWCAELNHC